MNYHLFTLQNVWASKCRSCYKTVKCISNGKVRMHSKQAAPALPQKNNEDELVVLHTVARSNKKITSKIVEKNVEDQNPIIFIRPKHQMLDLSRIATQMNEKSVANFYTKDLLRLIELYNGSNFREFDKDFGRKQAINTVIDSSEVVPLKLVNAIEPQELEWKEEIIDWSKLTNNYMKLSKIRLTGLVVLTTLGGYMMAPAPLYFTTCLLTCGGTFLTSASANAINQFFEVPFDSQMKRTKNRVLVKGHLTPLHAFAFATACGLSGLTVLALGANGLTATLGALNLLLYTCVYTPMKRLSILNTWVGSVVGAIPPVMGWVACTGSLDLSGLLLGAILFAWQFPHFNALSWNLRADYARGGYRMMSVIDPDLCRRTTLRYSVMLLALCTAAPLCDLTTWFFAVDSLPVNLYFIYLAWQFHQNADSASARKLFRASLLYLPIIMLFLGISKKPGKESKAEKSKAVNI